MMQRPTAAAMQQWCSSCVPRLFQAWEAHAARSRPFGVAPRAPEEGPQTKELDQPNAANGEKTPCKQHGANQDCPPPEAKICQMAVTRRRKHLFQ